MEKLVFGWEMVRIETMQRQTDYIEHKPAQQFRAFPAGEIPNLMNIGVADDQAKQRFGLYENGCDLGGETPEK